MDDWGDPWAEEQSREQEKRDMTNGNILSEWHDDAGWGEVGEASIDSKIADASDPRIVDPSSRHEPETRVQIPQAKHTASDNIDSAVSFGKISGDVLRYEIQDHLVEKQRVDGSTTAESSEADFQLHVSDAQPGKTETSAKYPDVHESDVAQKDDSHLEILSMTPSPSNWASYVAERTERHSENTALLIARLFDQPERKIAKLSDESEDAVMSVSARKAWYRITRTKTLREFNGGGTDQGYVRIRWQESEIRKRTLEIVSSFVNTNRPNDLASFGHLGWKPSPSYGAMAALGDVIDGSYIRSYETSATSVDFNKKARKVDEPAESSQTQAHFGWSTLPAVSSFPPGTEPSSNIANNHPADEVVMTRSTAQQITASSQDKLELNLDGWVGSKSFDTEQDEDWGEMVESPSFASDNAGPKIINAESASLDDILPTPATLSIDPVHVFLRSLPDLSYMLK